MISVTRMYKDSIVLTIRIAGFAHLTFSLDLASAKKLANDLNIAINKEVKE